MSLPEFAAWVLSDQPCARCGHAVHTYLACSDTCSCTPIPLPGAVRLAA